MRRRINNKLNSLQLLDKAKKTYNSLDKSLVTLASRSRIASSLYYLVNSEFTNEHKAVLSGRMAYYKSLSQTGFNSNQLRRNIHRLEKGLIMRPRKDIFAEAFILETVECFNAGLQYKLIGPELKKWATDVLDEYFKVVKPTPIIDKAKRRYINTSNNNEPSNSTALVSSLELGKEYKPYKYNNLPTEVVSFEEIKQLFIKRRSVRWFDERKVSFESVQKAANIASLAPSACNRQPYRFLFSNQKDLVTSIAQCALGASGFADNIPSIIVIVGDLSAYPSERDRHVIYIDSSLAAMQMMLALETIGLSTCSINWPDIDRQEKKIRKTIKLKDHERIVMLLAVGYADPDGGIPYSQKKINDSVIEDISK